MSGLQLDTLRTRAIIINMSLFRLVVSFFVFINIIIIINAHGHFVFIYRHLSLTLVRLIFETLLKNVFRISLEFNSFAIKYVCARYRRENIYRNIATFDCYLTIIVPFGFRFSKIKRIKYYGSDFRYESASNLDFVDTLLSDSVTRNKAFHCHIKIDETQFFYHVKI